MSMNLYWEPTERAKERLPEELKFALRKRGGGQCVYETMTESEVGYLRGLYDAGIESAMDLIDAIAKHGSITVSEE